MNHNWIRRRSDGAHGKYQRDTDFSNDAADGDFQRDRARIIHSASFRALQSKTQVLGLGESDFYRTRLTHSLEVAQIGSGICEWLKKKNTGATDAVWIPSFSLIEAICLAHDIGHSPFGHGGEVALNARMYRHGGFEANGQTLRILARLGEYSTSDGLDLTRRTMLGTIKYPALYSTVANYRSASEHQAGMEAARGRGFADLNIDHLAPPKCIYDNEHDVLDWLLDPFSAADRERFRTVVPREGKHARSIHKPFDTSIMELADDIAYGIHDLEDALTLGLVDREHWREHVAAKLAAMPENPVTAKLDDIDRDLFSGTAQGRKHAISRLVRFLIQSTTLVAQDEFEAPLLRLQASMTEPGRGMLNLIKDYVMDHVIFRPELQHLQYKGQRVMIQLFDIFEANPRRLLPHDVFARFENEDGHRAIADYLSAMTDVSAGKLYHKLMSPASGSIYDRP